MNGSDETNQAELQRSGCFHTIQWSAVLGKGKRHRRRASGVGQLSIEASNRLTTLAW